MKRRSNKIPKTIVESLGNGVLSPPHQAVCECGWKGESTNNFQKAIAEMWEHELEHPRVHYRSGK